MNYKLTKFGKIVSFIIFVGLFILFICVIALIIEKGKNIPKKTNIEKPIEIKKAKEKIRKSRIYLGDVINVEIKSGEKIITTKKTQVAIRSRNGSHIQKGMHVYRETNHRCYNCSKIVVVLHWLPLKEYKSGRVEY